MNYISDRSSAAIVSDFLLNGARERGEILTNLKLQKLLYYSQAWHLAIFDNPLFGEDFQAWVHGPVLPSQYHRFKDFQWRPIMAEIQVPEMVTELEKHLTEILDVFGSENAVALEIMTHKEAPWIIARGDLPAEASSTAVISKASMKDFYSRYL